MALLLYSSPNPFSLSPPLLPHQAPLLNIQPLLPAYTSFFWLFFPVSTKQIAAIENLS